MSASHPYSVTTAFAEALRLSRRGETLAGLKHARTAFALARKGGDAVMIRRGLNTIAICQASHGNFIEAIADAIDAYNLAKAANDLREATHALATLVGASGFLFSLHDKGIALLDRCLANAIALSDVTLECRVRSLRGMRLGSTERYDEAEQDFAVALSKVDGTLDNIPVAMIMINMASLSNKRAKKEGHVYPEYWAIARVRHHESIEIARRENNPAVESRSYVNIGEMEMHLGNIDAAMYAFNQALDIAQKHKQRDQTINIEIERGGIFAQSKQFNDAIQAFETAFNEAGQHRPTPQLALAASRLAEIYSSIGDTKQVAHWQQCVLEERAAFASESAHAKARLEAFWVETIADPA